MYSASGGMPNYSFGNQSTQPPPHYGYGLQTPAQSMFRCYERGTACM